MTHDPNYQFLHKIKSAQINFKIFAIMQIFFHLHPVTTQYYVSFAASCSITLLLLLIGSVTSLYRKSNNITVLLSFSISDWN